MKDIPSHGYLVDILPLEEIEGAVSCMKHLREYMIQVFPEKFPRGKDTDFSLVIQGVKDLISQYMNLKNLMED